MLSGVEVSRDVLHTCMAHALSTEREEIMGLLLGDIEVRHSLGHLPVFPVYLNHACAICSTATMVAARWPGFGDYRSSGEWTAGPTGSRFRLSSLQQGC